MQIEKVKSLKNNEIENVAKFHHDLTIQEFINLTNFDIDMLKMDIFWHSIGDDNKWIYVDKNVGEWMGLYKKSQGMGDVYESARTHLIKNEEYILYENFD